MKKYRGGGEEKHTCIPYGKEKLRPLEGKD